MGFSYSSCTFSLVLVVVIGFAFLIHTTTAADIFTFVFKGCSGQANSGGFKDTVAALFNSLLAQASSVRFFKTSSGSGQTAVSGLFQCRGDLSNADCYSCVRRIYERSNSLCGNSVAARIQLSGCYVYYSIAGSQEISGSELQYKTCGKTGASYEEKRDTAISQLESGIAGGSGFYATTYASVYVIGQCQGDLSVGDCGECVKEAAQKAEVECGNAISGQVYLHRCYISYSYYPNGIPGHSSSGSGQQTGKTVAIVFGGAFALFFVVICLLFLRSISKKRDDY